MVNAIDHLKNGLEEKDHKVYIFAPAYKGYKDANGDVFRFRSFELSSKLDFPFAVPYSRRVNRFLAPLTLELVHAQHPFLLGVYGARLAKRLNIPLVFTFHTQYEQYAHYIPLKVNTALIKGITRKLICNYANQCQCIIIPSPSIKDLLKSYGIKTRLEVVPNAVDLAAFSSNSISKTKKELNVEMLLLYVGRIAKEKNLVFMLDAFMEVCSHFPKAYLLFVGGGPWEKELKEEIRKRGLGKKTSITGYVPYKEIPGYMASSDLLLMTSTSEVKPLVVLEAMAAGLPIVAVDAPGAGDTITSEYDGILTPLSVNAYSQALARLLADPDLRRKLSNGAKVTAIKYSVNEVTERLIEVYRSVLPR